MVKSKKCDLCGLPCGKHPPQRHVGEADLFFCCLGCMNVYLILWESGAIRAGQDIRQTELFQRSLELGLISNRSVDDQPPKSVPESCEATSEELLLHVSGMWCTSCAWLIEQVVKSMYGVVKAEASFASDLVKVQYEPRLVPRERIIAQITGLGYSAQPYAPDTRAIDEERRALIIRTGLAGFLWANIMSFSLVLYAGYFEHISDSVRRGLPFLLMALATPVVFYCAQPILQLAWRGLIHRTVRMESLLALGILAAYGYSVVQAFRGEIHLYFDTASAIVALVLAGKVIEHGAKAKVSASLTFLHQAMPNKVRLLQDDGERFVNIQALEPGNIFLVKAGERIPADGVVVTGESHADESLLTGESRPVGKFPGEGVIGGSINLDGVLHIRATKHARDSTLSRVLVLVEQGLSKRSDLERAVDRVSRIFVPFVTSLAFLTFLFLIATNNATFSASLMRAITILVIACPCALGLATPLALTAAYGAASRKGILIRDGSVLERVRNVKTIIFDKTGTLTEGKFRLMELVSCRQEQMSPALTEAGRPLVGRRSSVEPQGFEQEDALSLLASLEKYSEHPLGRAVMEVAQSKNVPLQPMATVEIHKGLGLTGIVGEKQVFVGNRCLVEELGVSIDEITRGRARAWEDEGKTVSFLGWDGELQALALFGDRVKTEAAKVVSELQRRGLNVQLVSGDSRGTTKSVASRLAVATWEAEVLPEQKVTAVQRVQAEGEMVALVGDGINDAPALAHANLGIAMGSGTDIAVKTAEIVLMNGSLSTILEIFDLSSKTIRVVRQNLFWAFFYNGIGIALAMAGVLNPIMAAGAMLVSSLSVVGNSMRLSAKINHIGIV